MSDPTAVHPGSIILDYLKDKGWTQRETATRLDCSRKHLNRIIQGHAGVVAEFALKLERVFGRPASFWLALQSNHDLAEARARGGKS